MIIAVALISQEIKSKTAKTIGEWFVYQNNDSVISWYISNFLHKPQINRIKTAFTLFLTLV